MQEQLENKIRAEAKAAKKAKATPKRYLQRQHRTVKFFARRPTNFELNQLQTDDDTESGDDDDPPPLIPVADTDTDSDGDSADNGANSEVFAFRVSNDVHAASDSDNDLPDLMSVDDATDSDTTDTDDDSDNQSAEHEAGCQTADDLHFTVQVPTKARATKTTDDLMERAPLATPVPGQVVADGRMYVGQRGWDASRSVPYVIDDSTEHIYVTTAALAADYQKLSPSRAPELDPATTNWIADAELKIVGEAMSDLRILPDLARDTVHRLSKLPNVYVKVVESAKLGVVLGRQALRLLSEWQEDIHHIECQPFDDDDEIRARLEERLDQAKLNGMSAAGLQKLRKLVFDKHWDVWRVRLSPGDHADVPPLEIELIDPDVPPTKNPYSRRYTLEEVDPGARGKWSNTTK